MRTIVTPLIASKKIVLIKYLIFFGLLPVIESNKYKSGNIKYKRMNTSRTTVEGFLRAVPRLIPGSADLVAYVSTPKGIRIDTQ